MCLAVATAREDGVPMELEGRYVHVAVALMEDGEKTSANFGSLSHVAAANRTAGSSWSIKLGEAITPTLVNNVLGRVCSQNGLVRFGSSPFPDPNNTNNNNSEHARAFDFIVATQQS